MWLQKSSGVHTVRAYSDDEIRVMHCTLTLVFEQLLGAPNRGATVNKQRLSHWLLDTISKAYEV